MKCLTLSFLEFSNKLLKTRNFSASPGSLLSTSNRDNREPELQPQLFWDFVNTGPATSISDTAGPALELTACTDREEDGGATLRGCRVHVQKLAYSLCSV